MKEVTRFLRVSWLLAILLTAAVASGRTWTSTAGTKLEADYVGLRNSTVTLRKADGKTFDVGLQYLSEADRAFVNEQSGGQPAAVAAPVSIEKTASAPAAAPASVSTSKTSSAFGNNGPIRKDILTDEQVAALKTEIPGKNENEKYLFTANASQRSLSPAELKRWKSGDIPFRVTADFMEISVVKGKTVAKRMPGYARIYVLDDAGEPIVSRRESMEKLCPT